MLSLPRVFGFFAPPRFPAGEPGRRACRSWVARQACRLPRGKTRGSGESEGAGREEAAESQRHLPLWMNDSHRRHNRCTDLVPRREGAGGNSEFYSSFAGLKFTTYPHDSSSRMVSPAVAASPWSLPGRTRLGSAKLLLLVAESGRRQAAYRALRRSMIRKHFTPLRRCGPTDQQENP
jgi:hypothetical protein